MPYGLYISAEGAAAQSRRLEVLANNLANVDTTAFKRDQALFRARFAEATERGINPPGDGSINDLGGGVQLAGTLTDFSVGPLRETGRDLDLAIQGDAFFQVMKEGKQYLTRAGNFAIDPTGQLVTQQGETVLSDGGTPIAIDPDGGPWTITPDGNVLQAGATTPLALVRPQSTADLSKVGESLYLPLAPVQSLDPSERRVLTGFVEGSGVRPTLEMMELIETSRAFESNVNMIKHQDQAMGTLISRVLKE